jgi:hypothetical protein
MTKRIIALICALFLLLPAVVSCATTIDPETSGNEQQTQAPGGNTATTTGGAQEDETTGYIPPEFKDLNGYVYRNLVAMNSMWYPVFFSENGEDGTLLNDALYRREMFLEEKFHCEVEFILDSKADTTLANHIGTGTDLCETVFLSGTNTMAAAKSGLILDINNLEGLELDKPWWDQRIQQEYLIGKHLFTLEGDVSMLDELRSICVVFNKDLYTDYNYNTTYGSLYDLVENGEWTLELLLKMIDGLTTDPTSETGKWGMLSEVSAPYYFFLGMGEKTVTNRGGEFTVNIAAESVATTLQYTMEIVKNPNVMIVNNGVWFGGSDVWNNATNTFKSGNVLFRSNALSSCNGYLDMSANYGILPVPNKGDSTEYYCYVSGGNHYPLSFPSNLKDVENAMTMTEATAYFSRFTLNENNVSLRDAFYHQLAEYRLARSPEDIRMLDIFFDSKTFDVDQCAKITGLESSIWSLAKAANVEGVSSAIASTTRTADKLLKNFLNSINKYYD